MLWSISKLTTNRTTNQHSDNAKSDSRAGTSKVAAEGAACYACGIHLRYRRLCRQGHQRVSHGALTVAEIPQHSLSKAIPNESQLEVHRRSQSMIIDLREVSVGVE